MATLLDVLWNGSTGRVTRNINGILLNPKKSKWIQGCQDGGKRGLKSKMNWVLWTIAAYCWRNVFPKRHLIIKG